MSVSREPERLSKLAGQGSALGRGIVAAQARGPDEAQLMALEQKVMASVAVSAAAVTAAAALKGAHVSAAATAGWLSAGSAKLVVALVATTALVGGGGVVVRHVAKARHDVGRPTPAVAWTTPPATTPPKGLPMAAPSGWERPALDSPALVAPPSSVAALSPPSAAPTSAITAPSSAVASPPAARSAGAVAPPKLRSMAAGTPVVAPAAPARDDETTLLVQAHQSLAAAPMRALVLMQEHTRRFPATSMDEERDLITVTALVNLDRMSEARRLAERFSAQHPLSTYAAKMKSILASKP